MREPIVVAMTQKTVPFSLEFAGNLTAKFPTPFHIYDEKAIRDHARRYQRAFAWVPGGFRNFFAV